MPVRVRYKPTDLSEGVVELILEADDYRLGEAGEVILFEVWEDDDEGKAKRQRVGLLRPGCWDSVVILTTASDAES